MSELHEAIERAERGTALYVWQIDEDSPWRITDWFGVPDDLETTRACGRVDLYGPSGIKEALRSHPAPEPPDKPDPHPH